MTPKGNGHPGKPCTAQALSELRVDTEGPWDPWTSKEPLIGGHDGRDRLLIWLGSEWQVRKVSLEGIRALKNQNKWTKVGSAHSKWRAWSELWSALRQNQSDRRALSSFT